MESILSKTIYNHDKTSQTKCVIILHFTSWLMHRLECAPKERATDPEARLISSIAIQWYKYPRPRPPYSSTKQPTVQFQNILKEWDTQCNNRYNHHDVHLIYGGTYHVSNILIKFNSQVRDTMDSKSTIKKKTRSGKMKIHW